MPAYETIKGKRRKPREAEQFKRGDALLPVEKITKLLGNENVQGYVGKEIKKETEERLAIGRGLTTSPYPKKRISTEEDKRQKEAEMTRERKRKDELHKVQEKARKAMNRGTVEAAMPL